MKVSYEVDPNNRLIVNRGRSHLKRFRRIIVGKFKVKRGNSLLYEIAESPNVEVPQKIEFRGRYSLDKNHNLVFTLSDWHKGSGGDRLRFRTKIVDAKSNEIVFLLKPRNFLKLEGSWQVDRNNRLVFCIRKEHGRDNLLNFLGAWHLNKNNEIIYKPGKDSKIITFKGCWDIKDRYHLSYVLDKRIPSGFDFKILGGQIVTKGKDSYVRFDVGLDASKLKEKIKRAVIFKGKWKIDKKRTFLFEGKKKEFRLKFTQKILGLDGLLYLESFLKGSEHYIGGGISFRW